MTRQKNKRGDIEKWNQTDTPEIPDIYIYYIYTQQHK